MGGWRELGEGKGEIRLTAGVQAKLIDLSSLSQLIINGVFCSSTAQNQLQFTPKRRTHGDAVIDRELDRELTGSQLCVYAEVETGVGTLIASIVHSLRPFNMPEIFTDYVAYSGPLDCAR